MADIELVIKINENMYKAAQRAVTNPKSTVDTVDVAIANGTPLITCKDCKHKEWNCCDYSNRYLTDDGFCNHAEKREKEN